MSEEFNIATKPVPTFYFIGVTTNESSIMKVFPLWMEILGYPKIVMEGLDLQIHDRPEAYRQAVAQIKYDPNSLGALVTTHKIDLYNAAKDMFDFLDPYARVCNEVSSLSKLDGRLEGHAKDPITVGMSLDAIIGRNYFKRTGGDLLCFGAGGSGVATALHLINKKGGGDRPDRFTFVDLSQLRLDQAKNMVNSLRTDIAFEYILNDNPTVNDRYMETIPSHSIVINATGMGKDTPGSPISWDGRFPMKGVAWEFNYRGERDFLRQAKAQEDERYLTVVDGWHYFLHGWTQVIAQVLHIDLNQALFERLADVAETVHK